MPGDVHGSTGGGLQPELRERPATWGERRGRPGQWTRVLCHCFLFLAFTAAGAALLVWPQWIALGGARASAAVRHEREEALEDRVQLVRALTQRLRAWQRESRKAFMAEEVQHYPALVRQVTDQTGVTLVSVRVLEQPPERWKSLNRHSDVWADSNRVYTGDIQPRAVEVVLTGSFEGIYRAVGSLCGQQQLFVPDGWELRPERGRLRAEIRATVFVIREPQAVPRASQPTRAPSESGVEKEGGSG